MPEQPLTRIIEYTLQKQNLYLYKFPLYTEGKRLNNIYIFEDQHKTKLTLDLDEVEWEDMKKESVLRQVFLNYNEEIYAEYV